ncbi:ribosomal protein S5 domain 2-like protein [Eremomyces bilateralis CBS 781.70]|uniref:Ribosomal RNA-processing protein 41 n=1 Tax=Eremomyces bilateralis CBS 781.70 TaxID=1392243 RepID=A0A6G1FUB8_9PEZI|nr:ribosomal protein S5 domain 2-like protein [Eremomyces bilateralis CBS 781.70]KAF1809397.1 ribosomal protein S5 domain 2-like protein [Eremomyces bilateralis CBS 781.70]
MIDERGDRCPGCTKWYWYQSASHTFTDSSRTQSSSQHLHSSRMPLDTSSYTLSQLRLDGRRWNELRRIHAQISTHAAADGSSYLEMGNTKVVCTVTGPAEGRRAGGQGGGGDVLDVRVEIGLAGFSGVERRRQVRGDKRIFEMAHTITESLNRTLLTNLFPRSTLSISLHVLSQDGSLLAALINAATLACVDAGVPMKDYLVACTAGCMSAGAPPPPQVKADDDGSNDPILDLTALEEQELPFLTVATVGAEDKVAALVIESRFHAGRLDEMLAVGVDGCKRVKELVDEVMNMAPKSRASVRRAQLTRTITDAFAVKLRDLIWSRGATATPPIRLALVARPRVALHCSGGIFRLIPVPVGGCACRALAVGRLDARLKGAHWQGFGTMGSDGRAVAIEGGFT